MEWKLSSELQEGDVVVTHTMRVLLGAGHTFTNQSMGEAVGYSFPGQVLNRDQVDTDLVPMGFTPNNEWTIQGNDLVRWHVEEEADTRIAARQDSWVTR